MDLSFLANIKPLQYLVVFGGIALLILLLGKLSKSGILSFNGKGLKIGKWQDLERTIIRQQVQFVAAASEECFSELKRTKSWDEWKALYIAERVKDVFQEMIVYNHISRDCSYVLVKKKSVWAAIQENNMQDPYYRSEEFKNLIYNWVEKTIDDLVSIREFYLSTNC